MWGSVLRPPFLAALDPLRLGRDDVYATQGVTGKLVCVGG